jgi:hypothetical protein
MIERANMSYKRRRKRFGLNPFVYYLLVAGLPLATGSFLAAAYDQGLAFAWHHLPARAGTTFGVLLIVAVVVWNHERKARVFR